MANSRCRAKVSSEAAIIRAVASSTAIEIGKSVGEIERMLRAKESRFRHIALAN